MDTLTALIQLLQQDDIIMILAGYGAGFVVCYVLVLKEYIPITKITTLLATQKIQIIDCEDTITNLEGEVRRLREAATTLARDNRRELHDMRLQLGAGNENRVYNRRDREV